MADYTVVEYFGEREGHYCGYCSGETSNISHGMMAYTLHPTDYKNLMDRGWRRSGRYVYKPAYGKSCCAQYTIRSHALSFAPTKSQKKVLKKFIAFLKNDKRPPCSSGSFKKEDQEQHPMEDNVEGDGEECLPSNEMAMHSRMEEEVSTSSSKVILPSTSVGPDPSRPLPLKAKDIRIKNKLAKVGVTSEKPSVKKAGGAKSLEDFIQEISSLSNPLHKFETRLIPAYGHDPRFKSSLSESFEIFRKYQMCVHKDPPEECTMNQFCRFLCNSSLIPSGGYGAFHLQYLLDGKIFCVGVVDVLPDCVSSVYLYYDPQFSYLSPGTFSALWELYLIRSGGFHPSDEISFYYMGFYIHTCPKMRYKGRYSGSELLCLETMNWFPLETCVPKLDASKYSRFDPNPDNKDGDFPHNLEKMLVLFRGEAMTLKYILDKKFVQRNGDAAEYARLVGKRLMKKMLLYRESDTNGS